MFTLCRNYLCEDSRSHQLGSRRLHVFFSRESGTSVARNLHDIHRNNSLVGNLLSVDERLVDYVSGDECT